MICEFHINDRVRCPVVPARLTAMTSGNILIENATAKDARHVSRRLSVDVDIRPEVERDYPETEELTRDAFWNLYVPGCDEHYLVHAMRSHPDFIGDLDCVAVVGGRIVGSILYTKSCMVNENGDKIETATFGPLCVHPEYQRQGIGSRLIDRIDLDDC